MHLTIYPALWFDNQALEAFEFYCSVFPNSMILEHNPTVVKASLSNQCFIGINGGPYFLPNPAISFTVICDSRQEITALWQKLILGGASLIDLGHYSWNAYYGWVQDQFGYTWQLQLNNRDKTQQHIIPNLLFCGIHQNQCSQALQYYQKIFPEFQRHQLLRYSSGDLKGKIQNSIFSLNHLKFIAKDSPDLHIFDFNESVSFVIPCKTQQEIDYYWNYFTEHGSESWCGWCKDVFGISWQVIPDNLAQILATHPQAYSTLTRMKKIIIEDLLISEIE
ncbi:VOC family protein [Acinetobacter sp. ANC 4910]|uniref:VOC family protein n=1 Tax=Acinetobacter sp. ANC 4910 TaxID=2529850 RepID=UPI00103BD041|nr:VOC family protein [Acinetobacter sp. ANC 4910]TCB38077.1 VOC family protein [Acinetobacter sp. ANC 4910]